MAQQITSNSIISEMLECTSSKRQFIKEADSSPRLSLPSPKGQIAIVIDRIRGESFSSSTPETPMTPIHPFENEIMVPLRDSFKLLEKDLNLVETREKLRAKAEEMLHFIGTALERARNAPRVEEERKFQREASSEMEIRVDYLIHELRAPLSAIVGILENYEDCLKEDLRTGYLHLYKTAESMHSDEVAMILITKAFRLETLIDEVRSMTEKIDSQVGIQFECPSPRIIVKGDFQKLKQILINLIANAVRFSPKPGGVVVKIHPQVRRNKVGVNFQVIDQGPGMSEEARGRLFKLFSRGDSSSESAMPSTGLGLFLSQKFANAMGGEIEVRCPERGSIFFFDLRLDLGLEDDIVPSPVPKALSRSIAKLQYPQIQILWAEDCGVSKKLIKKCLSRGKHQGVLMLVDNGQTAVDEIRRFPNKYHVVLLDKNMPVMGGWEAAQAIHRMSQVPMILVSAISEKESDEICQKAAKLGINLSFLAKPMNFYDLVKRINQATQSCFNT